MSLIRKYTPREVVGSNSITRLFFDFIHLPVVNAIIFHITTKMFISLDVIKVKNVSDYNNLKVLDAACCHGNN